MSLAVLQVESPGLGLTIQDRGRVGWRRFGVPSSGCMDDHAALWANRLLDNSPTAAVIELLVQGATLRALADVWVAVTGADCECNFPTWRAIHLRQGEALHFAHNVSGLWAYVSVEGGLESETVLGSRSTYARGKLGRALVSGEILARQNQRSFTLPTGVAGRAVPWAEVRDYTAPPPLSVWPGPQLDFFTDEAREQFFASEWSVSSQSDRVGYRLSGKALRAAKSQIRSEPVRVGSIQVPENGEPIVTMRDGPTVGGYPKLGMLDAASLSWLAQCRPGQKVRFCSASNEV